MSTPELDIWQGDWGLPSVDLNCLQVMAFAKFSGAPLKIKKTNNPWRSPSGSLPVYRHGQDPRLTSFEDIISKFKGQNYNADFELQQTKQADIRAYSNLLEEKLLPGLLYTWWLDSKNYIDLTRPWYAKALPFPLNYFIPGQMQRNARKYLLGKYGLLEEDENLIENLVFKSSQECLTLLANRLGDEDFFFGRSPSSLDAIVFAYLAPLLKVPFANPALQNYLKACDNLIRFVVRILHRYFPLVAKETKTTDSKDNSGDANSSLDDFPHRRRNQLLSGFVAVFAMIGYALLSGLVQVDFNYDDLPEDRDQNVKPNYVEDNEDEDNKA